MPNLIKIKEKLQKLRNKRQAVLLQRFFKTGKGEYGEGDIFLGIKVPIQRKIAKEFNNLLSLKELEQLLNSKIHEYRLIALFLLINLYKTAKKEKNKQKSEKEKQEIFNFYLKNAEKGNINNWDLIDLSSPNIVGDFLLYKNEKERQILYSLAKKGSLWQKRIAILATFSFIRENNFQHSLKIAELMLKQKEKHDLIHKAVGWMLREIGKRDKKSEEIFLREHYKNMPRTMLRYAIEKFPENERKFFLTRA